MNKQLKWVVALILATGLTAAGLLGCSTNQTTAAYKGEVATDTAIATAMSGWGAYVSLYHPGTNTEQKVFDAFALYKQSEITLIDATASLAGNPTNTAPQQAALNAVAATQLDLLNLITTLTNSPTLTHP